MFEAMIGGVHVGEGNLPMVIANTLEKLANILVREKGVRPETVSHSTCVVLDTVMITVTGTK